METFLHIFNAIAWIVSNVEIAYISFVLVVFTIFYVTQFDPKATTAGKFIFRFIFSLVGIIGLVFIGLFVDPQVGRQWYQYPGDVIFWRPVLRLIGYSYATYAVTALTSVLVIRRFWPERLRTSIDQDLVKRRKLHIPRR